MRASPYLLASFGLLLAVLPGCATNFDGTSKEALFTSEPPEAQVIVRDPVIGTTPFSHKLNKHVREATFVRDIDEERKVPIEATFKTGFSLAVQGAFQRIGGDFDGSKVLVSQKDLILLPDYGGRFGRGFGLALGHKSGSGIADFYYESTKHDGTFQAPGFPSIDIDGQLTSFGFRGRLVPSPFRGDDQRLQPFFMFGFGLNRMRIKDGSTDGTSVGDGKLRGWNGELGTGLIYNIFTRASLLLDLGYRWTRFTSASGVAASGSLDSSVRGDGIRTALGIVFVF